MNDKFTENNREEDITQILNQVADQTHVNAQFAAELEEKLRNTSRPQAGWFVSSFRQISPVLRWATLMVLLALVLSWSIKSLIPAPQPFNNPTPGFVCPVTQPNGSLPPGTPASETTNDPDLLGNGQLWTVLSPGGKTYLSNQNQRNDGSFQIDWPWYRGAEGQLTIEGHRLDAQAGPLRYDLPEGFNNFQGSTLIFPSTGCWEITGRVGDASLTFVTEILFDAGAVTPTVITTPGLVTNGSATPVAQEAGYDFRGGKLFLQQPLPESPDKAHIYVLKKDVPATRDEARLFADRFGIQGEIYSAPNYLFNTTDYVISDGKQMLEVYSNRSFTYFSDMAENSRNPNGTPNKNAEMVIREFLQAHGFNFQVSIYASEFFGGYIVQPLAPDGISMQYESYTPPVMRVTLDKNGQVLSVTANLMEYDPNPVGEYGIVTAQEALDKLRNDSILKMEFVHSASNYPKEWYRVYPDNQPLTIYGYLSSNPALDPGKPGLFLINGMTLTGNLSGLESLERNTYIKATGQFSVENGIRKFNVQSWDRKIQETYMSGTLSRQGDQIILTSDDGSEKQYALIDPPADLPLNTKVPDSQLAVSGVIVDGKFFWTYIQYFANNSGGGGGGGGNIGFYKLNLSGTPVPFPSPTPPPAANNQGPLTGGYIVKEGDTLSQIAQNYGTTVDELVRLNALTDTTIYVGQTLNVPVTDVPEQKVEDLRGYLSISIHNKPDGTSSKEYTLEVAQDSGSALYTMEGSILNELDPYNGLPILVSGRLKGKLVVDRYKIPYPDLHFQILKGTQKAEQVGGQTVIVFTTEDGKSYVQFLVTNNIPDDRSFTGYAGDLIQQEVLIIPDETFGGMPVAHVYQSSIIQENAPKMEIQGNRVYVYNEPSDPGMLNPPTANLTIDKVELTYFVSNPYYQVNDPNYDQRSPYIQPVWHFQGRYDNGTEFDVLIQALKQEFLLPEPAPSAGLG